MVGNVIIRSSVPARIGLSIILFILFGVMSSFQAHAAPYAAMVMDARTGEVFHSRNADTRLHPASLTKMMTLYIAFQAVENGEIGLDDKVTISKNAASEPPSKLGLRAGQKIAFRYLIRAAAIKSANDAATAIGETISGSEAAFARRMTRTARQLGMKKTTFKNAHGLTASGHLSTARDMTILGRHLFYDYPDYYNLFSRKTTNAGVKRVSNTNARLLSSYSGADGIKTGYTRAAGYNLVSSARRGQERIIATVFGGKSSASRAAKVSELLNLGFRKAPSSARIRRPQKPIYLANADIDGAGSGRVVRASGLVARSLRPKTRPGSHLDGMVAQSEAADAGDVAALPIEPAVPEIGSSSVQSDIDALVASLANEPAKPKKLVREVKLPESVKSGLTEARGGWGVSIGLYNSRYMAEKALLRTALSDVETLKGSDRQVFRMTTGFDARFLGMSKERADIACQRLRARSVPCSLKSP